MKIIFNDKPIKANSIEELGEAIEKIDQNPIFELWISVKDGPSLCMLRNHQSAWLMYLRFDGDSGFTSVGDTSIKRNRSFTLSNGQVDEYPLAWCIDLDQCYQVLAYFFVNDGEKAEFVIWQESS